MHFTFSFLITLCLCTLPTNVPSCLAEVIDRSVAVVNDDIITLSEVNELGKPLFQKAAAEAPADQLAEVMEQIRVTVINKLIDKKLMLQEAEKMRISVSDEEVENAIERILTSNRITREQFLAELDAIGMDEQLYKEDLRGQILSSKLVNYEVRAKVIIPEDRIIDYYDQHYTEQVRDGGYYLLQIGVSWTPEEASTGSLSKDEAKQKITKVKKLADQGHSFKDLAREYSDLPSAEDGGDLGVFKEDEMAPFMKNAVIRLKPGEVSDIVETQTGYQLFSVLSNQEGKIITKVPYESVKEEIREKLQQEEMTNRYNDWLKGIREKAYIKIL